MRDLLCAGLSEATRSISVGDRCGDERARKTLDVETST